MKVLRQLMPDLYWQRLGTLSDYLEDLFIKHIWDYLSNIVLYNYRQYSDSPIAIIGHGESRQIEFMYNKSITATNSIISHKTWANQRGSLLCINSMLNLIGLTCTVTTAAQKHFDATPLDDDELTFDSKCSCATSTFVLTDTWNIEPIQTLYTSIGKIFKFNKLVNSKIIVFYNNSNITNLI